MILALYTSVSRVLVAKEIYSTNDEIKTYSHARKAAE